jgi:TrmH family RNA methyltransferase
MPRIDSPSNPRIAAAVRAVAAGDRMLLEGRRMVEDALDAGVALEDVFVLDESFEENEELLRRLRGDGPEGIAATAPVASVSTVSSRVLNRLSDLQSTRGVAALAAPPHRTLAQLSSLPPSKQSSSPSSLFLLLDAMQDPANVGAIVRCAEAFGAAGMVLTPGSAWPFSPRALRASAGSALRVPIVAGVAAADAVAWARSLGATLAGAEAHGGASPESAARVRPLVLVLGSEGRGISPDLEAQLDLRLTLALGGGVESLNAAVAAGLLLFVLGGR